jgi:hypothetical protein
MPCVNVWDTMSARTMSKPTRIRVEVTRRFKDQGLDTRMGGPRRLLCLDSSEVDSKSVIASNETIIR